MKPPFTLRLTVLFLLLSWQQAPVFSQTITRGAYLQSGGQTSIKIHWRTNVASNSRVRIGSSYLASGLYATVVDDASSVTEHIVTVSGLTADTKYFYSIGTSTTVIQVSASNFFTTLPSATPNRKIRIAAFGDCGKNTTNNSAGVNGVTYQSESLTRYQTYLASNSIDAPDAWLLLGDNAYNAGTDAEYTSNFFGTYGANILLNHKLYPTPGNHDYANDPTRQDDHAVPYYSIFDLPGAGELGGVASGKEEYYSFDIGNIHFLALDAYGEEANKRIYTAGSAQAAWVQSDLAANTKKWVVAYWHHPPYTMGSHNSDSEGELISMRSNFISILENAGVDLIINGHSHDYERSYLIKGHYGLEATFSAGTHAVSTSSAKYTSNATCPYVYNSSPANHGTVYVVAGSTGASGNTQAGYPHNAFPYSVNDGGFFYFEVDDNRLDAKFIRRDGTTFDNFTIMKDVNTTTNYTIPNGGSQQLTASWPQTGNYTWTATSGTTRSVSVSPSSNTTTNYTVTDAFGCVTDQFAVTTSNTLPVSLLSYSAALVDRKVIMKWSTSSEINADYYTVERSSNAIDYTAIGNVQATGTASTVQSYSFTDELPLPGTSFYRLSQTDADNHKQYIGVKKIDNSHTATFDVKTISTYNNTLTLQISTAAAGFYEVQVYDLSGRKWKTESANFGPGMSRKEIRLNKGVYIWKVQNEKGESLSQKVSIQ
ncbi:MAG: metallophosphoesterase [Chitinophagaceae bacterium]